MLGKACETISVTKKQEQYTAEAKDSSWQH